MKPATLIAAVVFTLIAIGHLLRLIFHVEITVNGVHAPQWASVIATAFFAAVAWMLWREARR